MSLAATGRARARGAVTAAVVIALALWLGPSAAVRAQPAAVVGAGAGGLASEGSVEMTVVGTAGDLQRVRNVVESRSLAGPAARWARVPRFDPMEILRGDRDSQ